jgi:hypothetical protein
MRALLDQGCDLEADVVSIVTRTMSDLPGPLKRWDAPWLVREILAARCRVTIGAVLTAPARGTVLRDFRRLGGY